MSNTKTVVFLSAAYPLRGGIASFTERLAYELISEGYQVIIYTFSLQYPNFLFPGKTQYSEDPAPKGLDIKVRINSINPWTWWKVGKEIQALKPAIVISRFWIPFMGPCLGTIQRLIRKNKDTKIVSIIDNIIPHEKRPGDRMLANYFVQSSDAFVVMSKVVQEEMKTFTQRAVSYIPHPIYDNYGAIVSKSEALSFLKLAPNEKYLLFFGYIRDYKGLDLLLKAMADQRIKDMQLKLIVGGEYYSKKEYYESLIKEGGIESNVILHTQFISNDAVRYYFCATDLVVQPYKSATQSGISQLAYFYEKPMLATNVGGLPEIVDNGSSGYIVAVNPTAIADAIIDYFEHNRMADFTDAVRIQKKRFSWKTMVDEIETLAFNPTKTPSA